MPQINFGKTLAQQQEEDAERIRELEAQVQEHDLRRQKLLSAYQRKTIRAKAIIITVFTLLTIALLVFGTYNTFFKKEKTDADIINLLTNTPLMSELFPDGGLEGYLKQNMTSILHGYIEPNKNSGIEKIELDTNNIYVTRVVKKDYQNAEVNFTVPVISIEEDKEDSEGNTIPGNRYSDEYNFKIYLTYDYSSKNYVLASKPEITLKPVVGVATENVTSKYVDFSGISELDSTQTSSAKSFMDTFLRTLYNTNSDITSSSDVSRENLDISGKTFVAIKDFHIYSSPNELGYNCFCDYSIMTDIGVNYNNRTYFLIDGLDTNTWKIRAIY